GLGGGGMGGWLHAYHFPRRDCLDSLGFRRSATGKQNGTISHQSPIRTAHGSCRGGHADCSRNHESSPFLALGPIARRSRGCALPLPLSWRLCPFPSPHPCAGIAPPCTRQNSSGEARQNTSTFSNLQPVSASSHRHRARIVRFSRSSASRGPDYS